jgi:hypothetical protein
MNRQSALVPVPPFATSLEFCITNWWNLSNRQRDSLLRFEKSLIVRSPIGRQEDRLSGFQRNLSSALQPAHGPLKLVLVFICPTDFASAAATGFEGTLGWPPMQSGTMWSSW